jgi:hypothetical protein
MRLIVALISSALVAVPALAQTSGGVMSGSGAELSETQNTPETTADANAPAPEAERMVCRRVEAISGSRLATRRVCRTAEQWRNAQRGS